MALWKIELVTNETIANTIELDADNVVKIDYHTLMIDGNLWELPKNESGLSFAVVENVA